MALPVNWKNDNYTGTFLGRGTYPLVECAVYPSVLNYLGDVRGKSIVDLACGEGDFCRILRSKGASRVLGVDISPVMIEEAKKENSDCEFQLGDVYNLGKIGEFDFITGNRILTYVETVAELKAMCRNIYDNLKPGGRFVGCSINCLTDGDWGNTLEKYGLLSFSKHPPGKESNRINVVMKLPDKDRLEKPFSAIVHYFNSDVYERVFREVGFRSFKLQPALLDDELKKLYPADYWDTYLAKPNHAFYVADK